VVNPLATTEDLTNLVDLIAAEAPRLASPPAQIGQKEHAP
jgi:hypothetical protein